MKTGTVSIPMRSPQAAGRLTRPARLALLATLASALGLAVPAHAANGEFNATTGAASVVGTAAINNFYAARRNAPIWLAAGQSAPAERLMALLATSDLDGVDPQQFDLGMLEQAVRRAGSGDRAAIAQADRQLSEAFLRYVNTVRRSDGGEWQIVDREAAPSAPPVADLLRDAAATGSLDTFLETMPWMHGNYAGLRRSLAAATARGDGAAAGRLRLNLERTRMLPAGHERYVLVNTASQRLEMWERGRVVDTMRVVVGKPDQPTPMLAALIRYTAVNPYWNLPPDLVAERVAPNVVKDGLGYLKTKGYVVLSDWTQDATVVDPTTIDWRAVAAGTIKLRVRQNPGSTNAMGRMKFMFPNQAGVYLHDTPNKELLNNEARLFSAGCVRLEDAPRLANWLYGRPLSVTKGDLPEQHVDLPQPVPVYLAYLTAVPSGDEVVFYDDIYGRDEKRMAASGSAKVAAR